MKKCDGNDELDMSCPGALLIPIFHIKLINVLNSKR